MVVSSPQCGENTAFSPFFPLAGSTAKVFFRLSLWSFKEKSINLFLWHSLFFHFSIDGSAAGAFYLLFPWNLWKIRHQPFPTAQPLELPDEQSTANLNGGAAKEKAHKAASLFPWHAEKGNTRKGAWGRAAGSDCSFIPWSPQKIPDKRPQA